MTLQPISYSTAVNLLPILHHEEVTNFSFACIVSSYQEYFTGYQKEIYDMVKNAFSQLTKITNKPNDLEAATYRINSKIFKKNYKFWFNEGYRYYKMYLRPQKDFRCIQPFIKGTNIFDYGSGGGFFALELKRHNYNVVSTDVLDYRVEDAKSLPFIRMKSSTDVPYMGHIHDTTILKTVLHHINENDIHLVLHKLRKITTRVIVEEDTYDIPKSIKGYEEALASQPLFVQFVSLPAKSQYEVLSLMDFFANSIALGSLGMPPINLPFQFKTLKEWKQIFSKAGFHFKHASVSGFERGKMHKNCQVWMVFD